LRFLGIAQIRTDCYSIDFLGQRYSRSSRGMMMHDYARALSGERSANGLTYATSTAGDEHNLAMQPGFHAGRGMFRYFMFSD
jgi:hypothetical protein